MKKLILPAFVFGMLLASCGGSEHDSSSDSSKKDSAAMGQIFGDTITNDGAVAATEVLTKMANTDSMPMKVTGTIVDVCQKKGCWMTMNIGNDQTMRIGFKDYAFFVPKDCSGKTAVLDGYAYVDTTSVAELRHYAEDAGVSKDSIEKITQPEIEYGFEARGVIIQK
jgi:hypothetical protein